jgi:hypothetical protein
MIPIKITNTSFLRYCCYENQIKPINQTVEFVYGLPPIEEVNVLRKPCI